MSKLDSPIRQFQDEDQIISHIKSIAQGLFDSPLEGLRIMDFEPRGIYFQNFEKPENRIISYTQRKMNNDDQQCQSQWITYENFQQQHVNGLPQSNNHKNNQLQKKKATKNINQLSKAKPSSIAVKNEPKDKNAYKKNVNKKPNQIQQQKQGQKVRKQKIKLDNLQQYGFMKHTEQSGRLKTSAVDQIYKNKQKTATQQGSKVKKNMKTLQQLYRQKQPLYEKYLKQKQKKISSLFQSKVSEQKKQIQTFVGKPEINSNIYVQGSFEQRLVAGIRKTQQKKSKIMTDILKNSTFHPQTNKVKKYNQVESIVKKNWSDKNVQQNNQQISFPIQEIKVEYSKQNKSKVGLQNNSVKSPSNKQNIHKQNSQYHRKMRVDNQFNFSLRSPNQLSNIFQMQDNQ